MRTKSLWFLPVESIWAFLEIALVGRKSYLRSQVPLLTPLLERQWVQALRSNTYGLTSLGLEVLYSTLCSYFQKSIQVDYFDYALQCYDEIPASTRLEWVRLYRQQRWEYAKALLTWLKEIARSPHTLDCKEPFCQWAQAQAIPKWEWEELIHLAQEIATSLEQVE